MSDEIFDRTRALVERIAGADRIPVEVSPHTRLADGFWFDSVELLEVVLACEAEFGIVFAQVGDLDDSLLKTLGSLVDGVRHRLACESPDR